VLVALDKIGGVVMSIPMVFSIFLICFIFFQPIIT
jgi:hypothetical protein